MLDERYGPSKGGCHGHQHNFGQMVLRNIKSLMHPLNNFITNIHCIDSKHSRMSVISIQVSIGTSVVPGVFRIGWVCVEYSDHTLTVILVARFSV